MRITKYHYCHRKLDGNYLLINTLTCKIIEVDSEFISKFQDIKKNVDSTMGAVMKDTLIKYNLLVDESFERNFIAKAYKRYQESLSTIPLTNFVFLTYDCNLRCTYCCYRYLDRKVPVMSRDLIDNMFKVMYELQSKKQKRISRIVLSGGEPLMPENVEEIDYFLKKLKEYIDSESRKGRNVIFTIFTNATSIQHYKKHLEEMKPFIDMVYVTLNGTKEMHDKHRIQKNKNGSYDLTISGIEHLLTLCIPTWIVANIGKDNISKLSQIPTLVQSLGWDKIEYFKGIYVSRIKNHKKDDEMAISELDMIDAIIEQVRKKEIDVNDFNFGDLKLLRAVMDFVRSSYDKTDAKLQFSGCNNRSSQYSYSIDGMIYPCAPSMGIKKYATGTFYPEIDLNSIDHKNWLDRLLPNVSMCEDCSVAFLCGGGCTFEAAEKNDNPNNPVCPNVDKILSTYLHSLEEGVKIFNDDILYK